MSLRDLEAFIRQSLQAWDPDVDITPGSTLDTNVVQKVLARVGTDPFSTNLPFFIRQTLRDKFPELAMSDIDELSDIVAKPMELLLAPIVRESNRIAQSQSMQDPSLLTREEAQSLGGNYFAPIDEGQRARGTVKVYFSSPRSVDVNPTNYCYTSDGLVFPPTSIQSIRNDEMLLNVEGSEYYFQISVEAEAAGDHYNIDPREIKGIADLPGAVRATNEFRFTSGIASESAVEYVDRLRQGQSEKSMVGIRGIIKNIFDAFPEVFRLAVVGYNDPEMQRDVIRGGGYGPIISGGTMLDAAADDQYDTLTSVIRVRDAVDFTVLMGPPGPLADNFALTMYGAFAVGTNPIQDVKVVRVIDSTTLQLEGRVVVGSAYGVPWGIRKQSITLSSIPGGILFPDGPNGTVTVEDDAVHIGGCTDVYIRGVAFDQSSLILDNVSDDEPGMSGGSGYLAYHLSKSLLVLADYTFYDHMNPTVASNYKIKDGDPIYEFFKSCPRQRFLLRIVSPGSAAGTYRIIRVWQHPDASLGQHPTLELDRVPSIAYGSENLFGDVTNAMTWKIQDDLDVDLYEPKETRWEGSDLRTYVGMDYVSSGAGVDFVALGVGAGDTIRISNGNDAGTYTISSVFGPGNTFLQLASHLTQSGSSISYRVFRSNEAGGIQLPLVRVTSIDILDTGNQPVGNEVPYGAPVFCRSNGFSNYANGTKVELYDACIGVVGGIQPLNGSNVPYVPGIAGKTLEIRWQEYGTIDVPGNTYVVTVTFTGGTVTLEDVVNRINAVLIADAGAQVRAAHIVHGRRLGISPIGQWTKVYDSGSASNTGYKLLFGTYSTDYLRWAPPISSRDVRSDEISGLEVDPNRDDGWHDDKYDIDRPLDGVDIRSGWQSGHYSMVPSWDTNQALLHSTIQLSTDLRPDSDVHLVVGSRSIGSVRVYFLDPVTIEFGPSARFTGIVNDVSLEFFPDSSVHATRIPAPPSTEEPTDGVFTVTGGSINTDAGRMSSVDVDFVSEGVTIGDMVIVRYEDMHGTAWANTDELVGLAGKVLKLSVDKSPDINIHFVATRVAAGIQYISHEGMLSQINDTVGTPIAKVVTTMLSHTFTLSGDVSIVVRHSVEADTANTFLGLASAQDQTNKARNEGTYLIKDVVNNNTLELQRLEGSMYWVNVDSITGLTVHQHFAVVRPGTQRISSTVMANNMTDFGLYYADLELSSRGVGNLWNISAGNELRTSGYLSYGYYLSSDPALSFSTMERPTLRLPPVVFPVGSSDSVTSALDIVGQNVQVTYDRSALVSSVQSYVLEDTNRVTNSSMLVRHLLPHFVRLHVDYAGGVKESTAQRDLEAYVQKLYPNQYLQATDVAKRIRGATYVVNPIDLVAVVHAADRGVWLSWSNDRINLDGRLAAFIPDSITLTRSA